LGGRARVNYLIQKNLHRNIKEAIAYPKALFTRYYGIDILERTPISFRQNLYYYFVNLKSRGYWNGSIITKFKNMTSPQQLRDKRNRYPRLINGGWHFSYLGGVDRIILKLNSFSETQPNNPKTLYSGKIVSHDYIKNCIENGEDIYGRKGKEYEYDVVNVDDQFPKYVHTLIQKYPYLYFDKM
jgi:beta-1,4-mannosyl-glycoprotein beta-1,4-N-acetylglucosaminyltransferase